MRWAASHFEFKNVKLWKSKKYTITLVNYTVVLNCSHWRHYVRYWVRVSIYPLIYHISLRLDLRHYEICFFNWNYHTVHNCTCDYRYEISGNSKDFSGAADDATLVCLGYIWKQCNLQIVASNLYFIDETVAFLVMLMCYLLKIYLAVHLNHGFSMARIDLVSTVGAKTDPENRSHWLQNRHFTHVL